MVYKMDFMSHTDKHESGEHTTVEQLAVAIMNHQVLPPQENQPHSTFRDIIQMDFDTPEVVSEDAYLLLRALKFLEEGRPEMLDKDIGNGQTCKQYLRKGLKVIDAYQKHFLRCINASDRILSNPENDVQAHAFEEFSRPFPAAMDNLREIAAMMRTLAKKLDITLTETRARK